MSDNDEPSPAELGFYFLVLLGFLGGGISAFVVFIESMETISEIHGNVTAGGVALTVFVAIFLTGMAGLKHYGEKDGD